MAKKNKRRGRNRIAFLMAAITGICSLYPVMAFATDLEISNIQEEMQDERNIEGNDLFEEILEGDMSQELISEEDILKNTASENSTLEEERLEEENVSDQAIDEITEKDIVVDETEEIENQTELVFSDGTESGENLPGLYTTNTLALAEEAYAILYENGDMVFQRGDVSDPDKGNVLGIYTGFEDTYGISDYQVPWTEECEKIRTVAFKEEICPTSMKAWFYNCTNLVAFDSVNLNMSALKSINSMFFGCVSLADLDVSCWDLSKVEDMSYAFYRCSNLSSLETYNWDLSNVRNMSFTFCKCLNLKTLGVSSWNLVNIEYLKYAFSECGMLKYLDTSCWDTSKVRDMTYVFYNCRSLNSLDTSGWNLSNVDNMSYMFAECTELEVLDSRNWNLTNIQDVSYTFSGCKKLQNLDVSGWNLSNLKNMQGMFYECRELNKLNSFGWELENITDMSYAFFNCINLKDMDTAGWKLTSAKNMNSLFYGCSSLTSLDTSDWNLGSVTNMKNLFYGCDNLKKLILGKDFRFVGENVKLSGESWVRTSTGETYSSNNLCSVYDGNTMADTYCRIITISFQGKGGTSVPKNMEGYLGMIPDELPTASKKGAHFAGWYTEMQGGELLSAGNPITQDIYYAQWEDYVYTLILKAMNESKDEIAVDLGYNTCYALSEDLFTYDGMELTGWNTRRDGSGTMYRPGEEVMRLSEDDQDTVILYAQWEQRKDLITISFDSCEGTEVPPLIIERGTGVNNLIEPKKEGYTFEGWHLLSAGGEKVTDTMVFTEDVVLYAEWKKNPVVTFDLNGGDSQNIQRMLSYGSTVGDLPVYQPNANRYMSMMGWFTDPVQGEQIDENWIITEDVIFYAHWGWKPIFNANGGFITEDQDFSIQESSQYVIDRLPKVKRDAYIFEGWYLADGTTQVLEGDCVDLAEGADIIAHWLRADTILLSLDPNGGTIQNSSEIQVIEMEAGKPVEGLPIPVKSKWLPYPESRTVTYKFTGWLGEDGVFYDKGNRFSADMVLTAQWEEQNIKVTFDADGGSGLLSDVLYIAEGNSLNSLPGAKKANYILGGWYTEKEGKGEKLTTDTWIFSDTTYYAYWIPFAMNEEDDNNIYTYGAEWGNSSNSNVDNLNDHLEFHPSDAQTQTAQLHVRFELNQSAGDTILPIGAVQIRIPQYVWKDWDGNAIGSNNISINLPEYPSVRNGMWFSYMKDGEDYVIINSVEMAGGAGIDLTVSYTVSPWQVPGGALDANGNYVEGYEFYQSTVPVTFTVDRDLDGDYEIEAQKMLKLEMHTRVKTTASKFYSRIVYEWKEAWGTKPSDADDYFYIMWMCSEEFYTVTNQPGEFRWSEDTVHDGTVIYQSQQSGSIISADTTSYNTVVTRHPMTLLADIPQSGLVLKNEAILIEKWRSGYETVNYVSASAVIYNAEYPEGKFDKYRTGGASMTVTGGQEDIADDKKEVQMSWELVYDGSPDDRPLWDEDTKTYSASNRIIRIRDGVKGDVMYSSGAADAKYIWDPLTGNIALSDDDYYFEKILINLTEYDARQVNGVWTDRYEHKDSSQIRGIDIWVRYKNADTFVYDQTVYAGESQNVIYLPEKCAGFEIRHETNFYSTSMSVNVYMRLKPTQKIQALINEDISGNTTSIIKNKGFCDSWKTEAGEENSFFYATNYTGGNHPADKEIYELTSSSTRQFTKKYTSSKGKIIFDVDKGTQDHPVSVSGWNYNTSQRFKRIKTGIFYDLLPAGTSVDTDTVFGIPINNPYMSYATYRGNLSDNYKSAQNNENKLDKGLYDVRFTDNWEGSQRTMMTIHFTIPDSVKANGVDFYYLLHNTYENIIENGTTVENDVAFVNTTEGASLPEKRTNDSSVITEKKYYSSLDKKYEGYISYSSASTNYIPVDAFSWGYDKSVKTRKDYGHTGEILPNREYTYRLSYSQSDYATSSGIVFYDILEYGAEGEQGFCLSEWYGTLKNINVKSISQKLTENSDTIHCAPVIYYSVKDRESFCDSDFDLGNEETWTTAKPEDASLITAVAVDCSKNEDGTDFILKGRQAMEVYLTMKAPENEENTGKSTFNKGMVYSIKGEDEVATPAYSDTRVMIQNVEPFIYKSSNPASGTKERPASVQKDEEIKYTVCVENPSDLFTLQDVVICDKITNSIKIDSSDIRVHFGNPDTAIKISSSPRVSMQKNGSEIQFTVSSLLPTEKVYLEIPVIVITEDSLIENTACISSVNGIPKNIPSETTYHTSGLQAYDLTVEQNVLGNMGDRTKEFHFRLKLSGDASNKNPEAICFEKESISGSIQPDENGMYDFTLSHGQSIIFKGITSGTAYEIIETDGEAQGYKVQSEKSLGMIEDTNVTAVFTNTKNGTVPTGADLYSGTSVWFVLISVLFWEIFVFVRRKA